MTDTARVHTEEAFRLLVEGVTDYAIFMLDPEGRVVSWNPGAERLKGYSTAEILGHSFSLFYTPEDRATGKPQQILVRALRDGSTRDEGWRVSKDGRRFWADVLVTTLRDSQGRHVGFGKLTRDLTERYRAEERIRALNRDLEERIQESETFAYTISHDLRAPLRAMANYSHLLLEEYGQKPLDATGRSYAQAIIDAARRMDALTKDLLAYSRLPRADVPLVTVSLDDLVTDCVRQMAEDPLGRLAEIAVRSPLGHVVAHRGMVSQVVVNLLSNAVKFVAPGQSARVVVRSSPEGDRVRLWVEDNGIGIAPEHRSRLFGVFERLNAEQYPGTGIGLAIVRKSMERMGGRVGVESEPGRGSRFWAEFIATPEGRQEGSTI